MSKTTTIVKMAPDGTLSTIGDGGRKRKLVAPAPTPMTARQIDAAARADKDNPPLKERLPHLRRVSPTKTLRRALGLTQEEFAARYQIPVGTLRDWEQGRSAPDQPARAYLKVIARDPEGIRKSLQRSRG